MQNSKWTLWNGILWMPKNEGSMLRYFSSTTQQRYKSLKRLRKAGKEQAKNKYKKRWLQKSSLKEFRKMREEWSNQWSKCSITSSIRFIFPIFSPTTCPKVPKKCGINLELSDVVYRQWRRKNERWSTVCALQ